MDKLLVQWTTGRTFCRSVQMDKLMVVNMMIASSKPLLGCFTSLYLKLGMTQKVQF